MENETPINRESQYVALAKRKKELESQVESVDKEMAAIHDAIVDDWIDRGQQNASIDGMTLYIANEFYCSKRGGVETNKVCDTLKANGLGKLVAEAYNTASLKSYVKEHWDEETKASDIPGDLAAMLNFDTVARLRTRAK